jgi:hypothetical protein
MIDKKEQINIEDNSFQEGGFVTNPKVNHNQVHAVLRDPIDDSNGLIFVTNRAANKDFEVITIDGDADCDYYLARRDYQAKKGFRQRKGDMPIAHGPAKHKRW